MNYRCGAVFVMNPGFCTVNKLRYCCINAVLGPDNETEVSPTRYPVTNAVLLLFLPLRKIYDQHQSPKGSQPFSTMLNVHLPNNAIMEPPG